MPPKKSTGSGAGTRSKRSALGQPTLSFAQQRKTTGSAKTNSNSKSQSQSKSRPVVENQQSTESISIKEDSPELQAETERESVSVTASESVKPVKVERRVLNPKSKEWAGVYEDAKVAMGNMEPIHAGPDTHNQVHHILRVFDMTSKYGPSVGMTRLQRWERAQKWGLNPPKEIRSILTTKEGEDDADYRENVLHTWL